MGRNGSLLNVKGNVLSSSSYISKSNITVGETFRVKIEMDRLFLVPQKTPSYVILSRSLFLGNDLF